jgi:hypothetical protein
MSIQLSEVVRELPVSAETFGIIAFSIFGEPYGVAAAATNAPATNSGATGTLTASGQGPGASVAADAATPAASPARRCAH